MKKIIKWIGIGLAGLIVVLTLAAGGMIMSSNSRLNRTYDVTPAAIAIPTDAESLAFGEHWAEVHCQACHGTDLAGRPFLDDPMVGIVDAPNLTSGEGGVADYTDADWVRAIRHGIKPDGSSVFIMPSNDFYFLSDAHLGSIIAYMKSVPPVDNTVRETSIKPFAKVLYALGAFGDLLYAETIPHDDPRPPEPQPGITVEYGDYLINAHGCRSCHGLDLSGMQPPEPGAPLAPNLTPGGELLGWTEADFIATLRTRVTPSGHQLAESMPTGYGKLTDDEMKTIWLYLQSLPALETTQ